MPCAQEQRCGFRLHTHLVWPTRGNLLAAAAARLLEFQFPGITQFALLLYLVPKLTFTHPHCVAHTEYRLPRTRRRTSPYTQW